MGVAVRKPGRPRRPPQPVTDNKSDHDDDKKDRADTNDGINDTTTTLITSAPANKKRRAPSTNSATVAAAHAADAATAVAVSTTRNTADTKKRRAAVQPKRVTDTTKSTTAMDKRPPARPTSNVALLNQQLHQHSGMDDDDICPVCDSDCNCDPVTKRSPPAANGTEVSNNDEVVSSPPTVTVKVRTGRPGRPRKVQVRVGEDPDKAAAAAVAAAQAASAPPARKKRRVATRRVVRAISPDSSLTSSGSSSSSSMASLSSALSSMSASKRVGNLSDSSSEPYIRASKSCYTGFSSSPSAMDDSTDEDEQCTILEFRRMRQNELLLLKKEEQQIRRAGMDSDEEMNTDPKSDDSDDSDFVIAPVPASSLQIRPQKSPSFNDVNDLDAVWSSDEEDAHHHQHHHHHHSFHSSLRSAEDLDDGFTESDGENSTVISAPASALQAAAAMCHCPVHQLPLAPGACRDRRHRCALRLPRKNSIDAEQPQQPQQDPLAKLAAAEHPSEPQPAQSEPQITSMLTLTPGMIQSYLAGRGVHVTAQHAAQLAVNIKNGSQNNRLQQQRPAAQPLISCKPSPTEDTAAVSPPAESTKASRLQSKEAKQLEALQAQAMGGLALPALIDSALTSAATGGTSRSTPTSKPTTSTAATASTPSDILSIHELLDLKNDDHRSQQGGTASTTVAAAAGENRWEKVPIGTFRRSRRTSAPLLKLSMAVKSTLGVVPRSIHETLLGGGRNSASDSPYPQLSPAPVKNSKSYFSSLDGTTATSGQFQVNPSSHELGMGHNLGLRMEERQQKIVTLMRKRQKWMDKLVRMSMMKDPDNRDRSSGHSAATELGNDHSLSVDDEHAELDEKTLLSSQSNTANECRCPLIRCRCTCNECTIQRLEKVNRTADANSLFNRHHRVAHRVHGGTAEEDEEEDMLFDLAVDLVAADSKYGVDDDYFSDDLSDVDAHQLWADNTDSDDDDEDFAGNSADENVTSLATEESGWSSSNAESSSRPGVSRPSELLGGQAAEEFDQYYRQLKSDIVVPASHNETADESVQAGASELETPTPTPQLSARPPPLSIDTGSISRKLGSAGKLQSAPLPGSRARSRTSTSVAYPSPMREMEYTRKRRGSISIGDLSMLIHDPSHPPSACTSPIAFNLGNGACFDIPPAADDVHEYANPAFGKYEDFSLEAVATALSAHVSAAAGDDDDTKVSPADKTSNTVKKTVHWDTDNKSHGATADDTQQQHEPQATKLDTMLLRRGRRRRNSSVMGNFKTWLESDVWN